MNFFEAQDSARRSTTLLVFLFVLAIAAILVLSNLIVFQYVYYLEFGSLTSSLSELEIVFDFNLSVLVSAAIIVFICLGSLYKLAALSSGGQAIALSLGGVIVPRSSVDLLHKKILNVVEEMAIASGTPVPQVYILNEQGINAFAAGWKTTNAVIGITQGALERLTRDELQGVIAHEFSHILNGDMRLNIRLIAILHGILMIGMLGRMILRSIRYVRASRNSKDGRAVLLIFGVAATLMVLGYTGTFFGNWIKALISRQREYLADASAVQFTRSSEGIANALKKIGGAIPGSELSAVAVDVYSHAYFARGDAGSSYFSFSTHPPLKKRILRIQPNWDGKYYFDDMRPVRERSAEADLDAIKQQAEQERRQRATNIGYALGTGVALNEALGSLDNIGDVSQEQIEAARDWHLSLPGEVLAQAENPYGAQALVLALLLHEQPEIERKQYTVLNGIIGELHTQNVRQVQQLVAVMARTQALSLIDLAMPTLREMTVQQYRRFKTCLQKLIIADDKLDLREWIVQRVVLQHLDEHYAFRKKTVAKYFVLGSAKQASEIMLSMLAYIEHPDEAEAMRAFDGAKRNAGFVALQLLPKSKVSIALLDLAMDDLMLLKPPLKKRFLQTCVSCISLDGKVTIRAYELARAIASCLDCPMPPVLFSIS
jgi:Zn-dependent protease with chaperone function